MTDPAAATTAAPTRQLVPVAPPEVTAATRAANAMFTQAEAILVDSPAMYEAAASELVDLRERWKAVEKQRVFLKEPFLEGGRRIDEFFRTPLARLEEAATLVKSRMLVFKEAEDRRAEEARLAQEAQERAEREELQRQQREAAERARLAQEREELERAEAEAHAEDARRTADAEAAAARAAGDEAAATAAEEAARLAQEQADRDQAAAAERAAAERLAAQQQAEDAQAAMDLADVAPPAPVVQSGARAAGVSGRKTWKVKTVDKAQLVIAAGKAAEAGDDSLLAYLDVNESALNGIAKALKGAARVAGVVFGEVTTLATTGRR